MVIGLILFAALGLAAGYALPGLGAWFVLVIPVAFALLTAFGSGVDGRLLLVLLLSLAVTGAAVIAGRLIDRQLSARSRTS